MQSAVPLAMAAIAMPLLGAPSGITLLLVNGRIWTDKPQQKEPQAIAIAGNRIAAIGSTAAILRLKQPGTWLADLHGQLVLPGFVDKRVHFYQGGADLTGPQLRFSKSAAEVRETLADFAANVPKGGWIMGGNWDCKDWKKPGLPTHSLIDSATRGHPAFLKSAGGEMWLANKLALKLAGIDRNTPNPPGGAIVRDAKGNPTGILKGKAGNLVERVIPQPSEEQIISALEQAEAYANARGVTSIRDVSCTPPVRQAYQAMLRAHHLTLRVTCVPPGSPVAPGFGSDWDNGPMDVKAYALQDEKAKRSIRPGDVADLVVLSADPQNSVDTRVLATIVHGVPIYGHLWPLRDPSGLILR